MGADSRNYDPNAQWTGEAGRPTPRPRSRHATFAAIGSPANYADINCQLLPEEKRTVVNTIKTSFSDAGFRASPDTSGHASLDIQRRQKTMFHATRPLDGRTDFISVSLIFLPHELSANCWQLAIHDPRNRVPSSNKKGTLDDIRALAVGRFLVQFRVKQQFGFEDALKDIL